MSGARSVTFVPWIVNAQIQRKEEGGNTIVTVIKRADTKGSASDVFNALVAATAFWLYRRMDDSVQEAATPLKAREEKPEAAGEMKKKKKAKKAAKKAEEKKTEEKPAEAAPAK